MRTNIHNFYVFYNEKNLYKFLYKCFYLIFTLKIKIFALSILDKTGKTISQRLYLRIKDSWILRNEDGDYFI